MAKTIPSTEPLAFNAGDTITWTKSLADFSAADGWVLNYRFINAANKFDVTASASGADHAININAATSAAYVAGIYSWQSYVTKAAERYTIAIGEVEIVADLAAKSAGFDTRTPAQKCLDQINIAFASYGNKAYTQEYEIAGRRMKFATPGEFLAFRSKVQQEVNREINANKIKNGLSVRNKSTVGF